MLGENAIKLWDRIHKWSSLVCTLFLLVLCLTGLPLIFKDEIELWFGHGAATTTDEPNLRAASLDRITETAIRAYPGHLPQSLYWDEHTAGIIRFSLAKKPNVPWKDVQWIAIDARTAKAVHDAPSGPWIMELILKLHKELLVGLPGELFLGVIDLTFLASLVSGIILYAPFMGKVKFGAVRRERSPRIIWPLERLALLENLLSEIVLGLQENFSRLRTLWHDSRIPPRIHGVKLGSNKIAGAITGGLPDSRK